jgi:3'-phosphoadenosine 5'-phosphosulfate (PAPS) 3'-phosphatase
MKGMILAGGSGTRLYPRLAPTMEWDTAAGHAVLAAAGGAWFKSMIHRLDTAKAQQVSEISRSSLGARNAPAIRIAAVPRRSGI